MANATNRPEIVQVNIYRSAGDWWYRADDADGYDHTGELLAETEAEARAGVAEMFPTAEVRRVADL